MTINLRLGVDLPEDETRRLSRFLEDIIPPGAVRERTYVTVEPDETFVPQAHVRVALLGLPRSPAREYVFDGTYLFDRAEYARREEDAQLRSWSNPDRFE